ncbi:Cof-like hydrolase [Staphylococcus lugdunensis M23590]|nr:Cof-like hydrolase [Staphylococcus lugdunensis M23590]
MKALLINNTWEDTHMFKLVVTDMDGTFLNAQGTFNKAHFQALLAPMKARGIRFAFCTGKQVERVEAVVGDLSQDLFIIGDSATRIQLNGENIYTKTLDSAVGQQLINKIKKIDPELTIIVCTPETAYVENSVRDQDKSMVFGSYEQVTFVDDLANLTAPILKITIYDHKAQCFNHVNDLAEFQDDLYIVAAEESWIDITDKAVDKGTTIQFLQSLLNIPADETIVFGDGYNDMPLFENAAYKVAMDNAYPELKEKANLIALNHNQDGVVTTLNVLLKLAR